MRAKKVSTLLVLLTGTFALGWLAHDPPEQPRCPTEDSCRVDYRDDHWTVTPTVP